MCVSSLLNNPDLKDAQWGIQCQQFMMAGIQQHNKPQTCTKMSKIKNKTNKQKLSYAKTNYAASVRSICKIYFEFQTHNNKS